MRIHLIRSLIWLISRLPLRINHALGGAIGWLLYWIPNPLHRVSRINLDLCLPELPAGHRRRILRRSLIETGKTAFEIGPLWTLPPERADKLIVDIRGRAPVDAALAAGRGLIIATPHLGSWEMAGHIGGREWGMINLYRPPRMPELERLMIEGRSHLGAQVVRTDAAGIRKLFETLRRGGAVGMLPDQDPGGSGGVFAPFFGIPANTMLLMSRLARKTGAALFIAYCERLPRARGYVLHVFPAPAAIADDDPVVAATAMNRAVEQCVRELPEQYQWNYRRFRTRPPGAEKIY